MEDNKDINSSYEDDNEINLKETFFSFLRYWHIFIFSLGLSLAIAYIYNRYSQKVYLVSSKILVQDEKKSPSGTEILKELDIFKDAGIVENEIEIIHSRPIIGKALDNLYFDVSYFLVGDAATSERHFSAIPFKVSYDTLSELVNKTVFELFFEKSGKIKLKYDDAIVAVNYNDLITTPYGEFKIVPNLDFNQNLLLDENYAERDFLFLINSRQQQVESYYQEFKVSAVNKMATVIELSIKTTVPEKGKDFLDEVAKVYIQSGVNEKNEMAANTLDFIRERLKFVTTDLTSIEDGVEQYKKEKGIADISQEARFFLQGVEQYDQELSRINMEVAFVNEINNNLINHEYKAPPLPGFTDPALEKLVGELYTLESLKINYDNTINADNPLSTILKQKIYSKREDIKRNVQSIIDALGIKKDILQKKLSGFEKNIKQIPTIERDLVEIQRQKTIKENLYLYLLQKQEESAIALASTVADNKVIEPAYFSDKPIKPVKKLSYLIALVLGLGLPMAGIYLKELLNDKVISKSVIEKNAKAPIIGIVGQSEEKLAITVHAKAKSAISEEFRSIRTNLQFMGVGVGEKVMLVTSSVSGEGKTFISVNLAVTFAISGKKTVVLEMDLRKPKLSKSFPNSNTIGISNYLIGMANIDDILTPSSVNENLYIISSGPIPPNPAELLMSDKLRELISLLREQFDFVIIDSPPIGLVTDSLIIAEHVDASLYIVRQNKTLRTYLLTIADLYLNKKMKKLSIVFNGIDRKLGNYGYGYGYGYGYYSEDENNNLIQRFKKRFIK
ncbi:MAG: GumC family protein [Bacteroidia bacterium]